MSRKSETEKLTEAVTKLTAAVLDNTVTLKKAMGQSTDATEDLVKLLSDSERHAIPEDAGPEEIVQKAMGKLLPGFDVSAFTEAARQEHPLPADRHKVPFQGLFGPRQTPPGPGERHDPETGTNAPREGREP